MVGVRINSLRTPALAPDMTTKIQPPAFAPAVTIPWPADIPAAIETQRRLARLVQESPLARPPALIGGVDVHLRRDTTTGIAVMAVVSAADLAVVELTRAETRVTFPYVPGLLSFRELEPVVNAFRQLRNRPDVLLLDGHGRAHPRKFGLACHAGLELNIPTIGCAKSRLTGEYDEPGPKPGDRSDLLVKATVIGAVVRTRRASRPLFVSIGHRVDLATATAVVESSLDGHRLPVPLRLAHLHARELASS